MALRRYADGAKVDAWPPDRMAVSEQVNAETSFSAAPFDTITFVDNRVRQRIFLYCRRSESLDCNQETRVEFCEAGKVTQKARTIILRKTIDSILTVSCTKSVVCQFGAV